MKSPMINWSGAVLCGALLLSLAGSAEPQHAAAQVSNEDANRGQAGGIKVHGRWTITVSNADGSVASRHEFNNALTPDGGRILAVLIGNTTPDTVQKWQVRLQSRSGQTNPCRDTTGLPWSCLIWEYDETGSDPHSSNLSVSPGPSGSSQFVLQGSIKTVFAGAIDDVSTALMNRSRFGDFTPLAQFTQHSLATPIVVQAGQSIDVKVVISMS
jgi:hypothetical protein